ncbi:DUF429 domain-containing protein [Streptomyces sp. NPDC087270]|uniref:DUF429 domain-containing protein n=1 Tax=Streptomyces sp. NPDC087270 TaxID=3365774 RepID=UPI00381B58C4
MLKQETMNVLGIDACGKQGWIGIRLAAGVFDSSLVEAILKALIARVGECDVVVVDMPLGLLDRGWRAADIQARAYLGARRSSVFLTAPKVVWDEADYAAASTACLTITGKKISQQAWALASKRREAYMCWINDPDRIHEVHPEVSFQAMAGGTPLSHSKRSWRGQAVRRALLTAAGIPLSDELGEAGSVPTDDVLDAAAAAWSAHRIAVGTAQRMPATAERDAAGRLVAIWY